jgi:hypothetical protein
MRAVFPPEALAQVAHPILSREMGGDSEVVGRGNAKSNVICCLGKGHFARFHTISSVRPASVRGFVNFISSAVMDVTIRR